MRTRDEGKRMEVVVNQLMQTDQSDSDCVPLSVPFPGRATGG